MAENTARHSRPQNVGTAEGLSSLSPATGRPGAHAPVGVGAAVHEPAAVAVHVHGPGLVVLAQHHVLAHTGPGHPEGGVWVVVVAVHVQLPVMHALGEGRRAQHHPVIVAAAGGRLVVVG